MEIDRIGPVARPTPLAPAGERFATPAPTAPVAAPPAAAAPPAQLPQATTSIAMLIAMASVDPVRDRRARAAAASERGVTLLERLHRALQTDAPDGATLDALSQWLAGFQPPEDPVLAGLADDVALRVQVELAKRARG